MSASVAEAAAGIRTALDTIDGLRVFDYVPDLFATPCAFVLPASISYWDGFSGGNIVQDHTVTVVVGRASERTAQDALYAYMSYDGASSVRAALEADRTLGGVCQTLLVERSDNIRMLLQGEQSYLAVDFAVRLHS